MTEIKMTHPSVEWARSRLDEMDASLTVFERKVQAVESGTREKAQSAIADMKKRRDNFNAAIEKSRDSSEKAWEAMNAKLEAEWKAFEDDVETFWASAGHKADMYEEAFWARAKAQKKAWHDTVTRMKTSAAKFQVNRKADFDTAVSGAESVAHDAGAKLDDVHDAGKTSWVAFRSALTLSRSAFDEANIKAQSAFNKAMKNDKTA